MLLYKVNNKQNMFIDVTSFIPVSIYAIAYNEIPLTLNHNLVTGKQYLLAITRLCVLEYCGPGMGCCCIGHGESRKALDSVCTIISQLDGSSLRDCNCAINGMNGGEKGDNQSELSWTQRRQGGICVSVVDITEFTHCTVRCWFGKWVWGPWRWWLQGRPQPKNPPRLSPPRCEGQRGRRMKGRSGFSCWWNHNTSHLWNQYQASAPQHHGSVMFKSITLVHLEQNTIITCMRGVGTGFLYASESQSHYPLTPVNPHFLLLWRSGKSNNNETCKTENGPVLLCRQAFFWIHMCLCVSPAQPGPVGTG